jgi:hypothetical protein
VPSRGFLLKGGEVIDPGAGLRGRYDVQCRNGRVVKSAPSCVTKPVDRVAAVLSASRSRGDESTAPSASTLAL